MSARGVGRRIAIGVLSWVVGMLAFWGAVSLVYGSILKPEAIQRVATMSGITLAIAYAAVYVPLFSVVTRRWQGDPRVALAVLGALLTVVPFGMVLLFVIGFDLSHLMSFSTGETVPSLLLFGVAGGIFGLLYR